MRSFIYGYHTKRSAGVVEQLDNSDVRSLLPNKGPRAGKVVPRKMFLRTERWHGAQQ